MHRGTVVPRLLLAALLALVLTPAGLARAATIAIATTADELTTNGACSLCEAIRNANADAAVHPDCPAGSGQDTLMVPVGTYTLSIAGPFEDAAATGDLDIAAVGGADPTLTIRGAGAGRTVLDGGGLDRVFEVLVGADVRISGLTVQNGTTSDNGGGLANRGTLLLSEATISRNTTDGFGGGIANEGTLVLTDVRASNNTAGFGGGLANRGTLTLAHSAITGNTAGVGGGIVNALAGRIAIAGSTVSGNTAAQVVGGVFNATDSTLIITDSTISGNTAGASGGGVGNVGTATLTNSTISANTAGAGGGGLLNGPGGVTTLVHVTLARNAAPTGGGIGNEAGGTVRLRGTIISDSASGGDCTGPISSAGGNLDSDGSCGLAAGGDHRAADPRLGPLADNGGPTATHALRSASPAIDAAVNCPPPGEDQRGVDRPQGARCDIGAYERERDEPTRGPTADRSDHEDKKDEPPVEDRERDEPKDEPPVEDRERDLRTEGNVVGVRCALAQPVPAVVRGPVSFDPQAVPYALIGNRDGLQQVRLLDESAPRCTATQVGDYLEADGVKVHEFLFEAENVTLLRDGRRVR